MTTRLEEEAQSHWQASHILRGVPLMSPEWKCPQNDFLTVPGTIEDHTLPWGLAITSMSLLCLYYRAASLSSLDKASMGTYDGQKLPWEEEKEHCQGVDSPGYP